MFDFYEGPAGTGKTYNLVARTAEIVSEGALGKDQKVLALTFMNGARRRLDTRFGENLVLRRHYTCLTFDVFARSLAARRRSLVTQAMRDQAAALNEFDGPCALAASLLENESVRQWVARSFPLVVVDEAQDLDVYRMRNLQGLSHSCRIAASADAFQCLYDGRDTAELMDWLSGAGRTHRLTRSHRTQQRGLLAAALAVRESRDLKAVLAANANKHGTTWSGAGFRLLDAPATNANQGLLAWVIANDISQRQGPVAILTPDANNTIIRGSLQIVEAKQYVRKNGGATFGPYPLTWERQDDEMADALLANVALPAMASYSELRTCLTPLAEHAAIRLAMNHMNRLRKVVGQATFTAPQVTEFVRDAVRNRSRLGFKPHRGRLVMTIQRAKNREFPNVIVLWPHTATGSPEHLRRLLYNGITRAQTHCTVIVVGKGRLNSPPFAP